MIIDTEARSAGEAGSASASDIERRVVASQVRVTFELQLRSLITGLAAIPIMVAGTTYSNASGKFEVSQSAAVWGLLVAACILMGLWVDASFRRGPKGDEETFAAIKRFTLTVVCAGAAWGSASWFLLPARSLGQEGFLLASMTMILAGGGNAQATYRPVITAFALTLTAVFVTGLLRFGETYYVIVSLAYAAYAYAIVASARQQERAVATSIRLSLANEQLLIQRTEQQLAAEKARADAEEARIRAELADRGKTSFMAAASHDLRQPMHALVQYVAHLKRTSKDAASGATIQRIEDSVSAMEDLLNAVLDFSKIAMGVVDAKMGAVELSPLLNRIDSQMRPIAESAGLQLLIKCDADLTAHSDDVLLERVVRNIVQNALRYTVAGSVVVRARKRRDRIRVTVADSGIGISPAEKGRIFDEYYQVDNNARDRRKGLGLGLAIVRSLAQLLGVRVRVKSVVGTGSTFVLDVPVATGARNSAKSVATSDSTDYVRGAFVVAIDDDPLARDALAATLRDFGCRVLIANSALEALHDLTKMEFAPQLIVSDYRLGGEMDGLQAIAMIQANQRSILGDDFALPAIIVSGDTSPTELERVLEAGHPMLHKPVSVAKLYACMNASLRGLALREGS